MKKKALIGISCIVIIVAIVCVSINYYESASAMPVQSGVEINNMQKVHQSNKNSDVNIEAEKGIDLYGMYDENDLIINEKIEIYNNSEIKIPQIDGLKNLEVQDKINKDMYNRAHNLLSVVHSINYTYISVASNFSNIISIEYGVVEVGGYQNVLYMNYNLLDGQRLKLEDIFVKDADITGIIRNAFYMLLSEFGNFEKLDDGTYRASPDENELYKIVKNYINNDEKQFLISPSKITFLYHDLSKQRFNYNKHFATVDMVDIADSVSIYAKYLTTQSIYEKDDIGRKSIFTCVEAQYDVYDIIDYKYLENNFWYDVTVEKTYFPDGKFSGEKLEKFEILKDKIIDEVYKIIEEQREIAKKNPDKFYILTFAPRVSIHNAGEYKDGDWEYTYSNLAAVNIYTRLFEMPFELYEEVYRDKLIETYRYEAFAMYGGMYYLFDEKVLVDGATCTFNADIRLYDYINNIEIKKLTEVFNEDSKYMDVINNNVKNYLRDKYEYEDLKIEELIKTINCELKGSSIEVTIPSIENFSRIVYFYEFEKDMFKSFEE